MNDTIFTLTLRLAVIDRVIARDGDAPVGFTTRVAVRDRIAHLLWVATNKANN